MKGHTVTLPRTELEELEKASATLKAIMGAMTTTVEQDPLSLRPQFLATIDMHKASLLTHLQSSDSSITNVRVRLV